MTENPYPLIDIGANLTHESFRLDFDTVLQRATDVGVEHIIVTGASAEGSQHAEELAQRYPQLHATAGIHPHEASHYTQATGELLQELGKSEHIVAMGECGLDFYRNYSPRAQQEQCFTAQMEIACDIGKPVFLHQRDAHEPFINILSQYIQRLNKVVVHCFTGSETELDDYLEMGCYIGMTGWICDERRGHHLREFIGKIPNNRLMLETDAPYILPRDIKPKPKNRRNEPYHLPHILRAVAQATGKPVAQVAQETTATAKHFFAISG